MNEIRHVKPQIQESHYQTRLCNKHVPGCQCSQWLLMLTLLSNASSPSDDSMLHQTYPPVSTITSHRAWILPVCNCNP